MPRLYDAIGILLLNLSQVLTESDDVIAEFVRNLLSDGAHFVDQWIGAWMRGFAWLNHRLFPTTNPE